MAGVADNARWYHTLELPGGIETPGWFDLRPIIEAMPWPDVAGKRCLDVGTYDGQLAFEMERRGAAEVIAADIPDVADWDWPIEKRESGPEQLRAQGSYNSGDGFAIAHDAIGSSVERVEISAYDLSPERLGRFDIVTCGSLMLHLKSPILALEAINSVCSGQFLSSEQIDPGLSFRFRKRPVAHVPAGERVQWTVPNRVAHRRWLDAAGFEIEKVSPPYAIPLGPGHPARDSGSPVQRLKAKLLAGGEGVPHQALLARNRIG